MIWCTHPQHQLDWRIVTCNGLSSRSPQGYHRVFIFRMKPFIVSCKPVRRRQTYKSDIVLRLFSFGGKQKRILWKQRMYGWINLFKIRCFLLIFVVGDTPTSNSIPFEVMSVFLHIFSRSINDGLTFKNRVNAKSRCPICQYIWMFWTVIGHTMIGYLT